MEKEELKREIKEILEIVKLCPQNLQEKCFEILLTHALPQRGIRPIVNEALPVESEAATMPSEVRKRVRAFTTGNGLTEEEILKVFAFDDAGNVSIEVGDLKTPKMAKRQRRLVLLIGVKHLFSEGHPNVPSEELRELCVNYGAYDPPNFSSNLKDSKEIFAGFKAGGVNKLSAKGKTEAAKVVKELAGQ